MIRSFKSRALYALWHHNDAAKIRSDLVPRVVVRLSALNVAQRPADLNVPGFNFHRLHGKPIVYSIHVNGPWCVTFQWDGEDAVHVNLEQYH